MAFVGELKARLVLDDGSLQSSVDSAISQIEQLKTGFAGLETAANSIQLRDLESRFNSMGQAGLAAFGSIAKSGGEYETALLRVNTIANLSKDELDSLGDSVRRVSDSTGAAIQPTEALASQYEILSSGFTDTADASKVLESALSLSAAGNAKAGDTTRVLTSILNAYGESADQAAKRADQLFQTVNIGVTTVPELSQSLGRVVSVASVAGIQFEELAGAIAVATQRGQTTSAAIDGLSGILNAFIKPTKEAQVEMANLGIVIDANTIKQDGLAGTLEKINVAANGNVESLAAIVGTHAAIATSSTLLRDSGEGLRNGIEQITNSAGSNKKAIEILGTGAEENTKKMQVAFENLKISASEALLPLQTGLTSALTDVIKIVDAVPGPIKTAALAFAGLGTALSLAAGGFVGLRLALGPIKAEMALLGATVVPRLTFAYTALNIPIGTAITLFLQKTAAMIKSSAAAIVDTARNFTLAGSYTALTTSVRAATSQFVIANGVMGSVALIGAGIAAGLAVAIVAYTELEKEVTKANEALLKSDQIRDKDKNRKVQGNISFSTSKILNTDVKTLAKQGLTKDTVSQRILDEQTGTTQLRNEGASEAQIQASISRANKLKQIRIDLEKEISQIREKDIRDKESARTNKPQEKTKAEIKAEEKAAKEKKKIADKAREEQIADARQAISNTTDPEQKKIEGLKNLIAQYQITGAERRSIEDEIFRYENQIRSKKSALNKKQLIDKAKALKDEARLEEKERKRQEREDKAAARQKAKDEKDALKGKGGLFSGSFNRNSPVKNVIADPNSPANKQKTVPDVVAKKIDSAFDFATGSRKLSGSEFGGQVLSMDQFIAQQNADFGNNPFQNRLGNDIAKKADAAKIDDALVNRTKTQTQGMFDVMDKLSKKDISIPITVNVDGKKAAGGTIKQNATNAGQKAVNQVFNADFVLGEP